MDRINQANYNEIFYDKIDEIYREWRRPVWEESLWVSPQESKDQVGPAGWLEVTDADGNTIVNIDGDGMAWDHAPTHENGGSDEIEILELGTSELNPNKYLAPDGSGGLVFTPALAGPAGPAGPQGESNSLFTDIIMGDGVEDTFALTNVPSSSWALVSANGADLLPSEYAIVAGDIVFDVAPANLSEILVTYAYGTIATGPEGPQGVAGPQGPLGPPGLDGEDGSDGMSGPQGLTGDTGLQGDTGLTGAPGTDGTDGLDGAQGPQGDTGLQGEQGIQGPSGADGNDGPQGTQGIPGEDGADGAVGATGETGAIGPMGPMGPQGEDGEAGPPGMTGPMGPEGTVSIPTYIQDTDPALAPPAQYLWVDTNTDFLWYNDGQVI